MSTAVPIVHGPGDPLGVGVQDGPAPGIAARSPLQLFWRRFRRDRAALAALAVIALLVVVALAAPVVTSLAGAPGPDVQDSAAVDQFVGGTTGPSSAHPFGVDNLGRDILSRVVYGARVSLGVAIVATLLSMLIGVAVGMVAGYYRGWVDGLLSRVTDLVLAFPIILLALGIASACSVGNGCRRATDAAGPRGRDLRDRRRQLDDVARVIRGQVLSLREREFVEAARSLGASDRRILVREILPNLVAPIVVYATLLIPQVILLEASLSFLGIGVQSPTASWGAMIGEAVESFDYAWWYMTFPGAALLVTVLAFNLLGDGLQDALDPRRTT